MSPPPPAPLSLAELFDEDRLEMMSCKYADYDPACLAAAGGGDWLEERPNPSLSPKAVREDGERRQSIPSPPLRSSVFRVMGAGSG